MATGLPFLPTVVADKTGLDPQLTDELSLELSVPNEPVAGEPTAIGVTVTTPDIDTIVDLEEELTTRLLVDGDRVDERTDMVGIAESLDLTFEYSFADLGETTVTVEGDVEFQTVTYEVSVSETVDVIDTIERSGASFKSPPTLQDDIDEYRNHVPDDLAPNAFVLADSDERYIVFTDASPHEGRATVEGLALDESLDTTDLSFGVIRASTVAFDTEPTETTVENIVTDPDSYAFELVRVASYHARLGLRTRFDDVDVSFATMSGLLRDDEPEPAQLFGQVGARVRAALDTPSDGRDEFLGEPDTDRILTGSFESGFWYASDPTVDGIVIPPDSAAREFVAAFDDEDIIGDAANAPFVNTIATDHNPTAVAGVPTLVEDAETLDGETVAIDANVWQQTLSVQETMEETTACGSEHVQIEDTCVDIVNDAVLHGGVAWSDPPTDESEMIPVVGMSTLDQREPLRTRTGEYSIVGEVLDTSRLDDSLPDGVVLLVYEMVRTGPLDFDALADDVKSRIENLGESYANEFDQQASVDGDGLELGPGVPEYADGGSGRVETSGLRDAITDWRAGDIDTAFLRDIINAWRSGDQVV